MIGTEAQSAEPSLIEKGRELLARGDIPSAVECYRKVFDPDSLDETEARGMLIEARSHLSRKHLTEALECFEEALVMGTEVQRRQALEGICTVGEVRAAAKSLTIEIKKGLEECASRTDAAQMGMALFSEDENMVLVSSSAVENLPVHLSRSSKIHPLPPYLVDHPLSDELDRCIPYTSDEDVRYILDLAEYLSAERDSSPGN